MIINRRTFEYGFRHVFRYYLKCFCCRSHKSLKQTHDGKRDMYFDRASRKLKKDLDIVTLLQIIQRAQQVQNTLFDKDARQLLSFQRPQVVSATSSVESD